jgi:hypothetical protein
LAVLTVYIELWHVRDGEKGNINLAYELLSFPVSSRIRGLLAAEHRRQPILLLQTVAFSTSFSQLTLSTSHRFDMLAPDFPSFIRDAKLDDFETIGNLDRACFINSDRYWQLVFSHIDPLTWLKWVWMDGARKGVVNGHDKVLVIERTDTPEIDGHACYRVYSEDNPPLMPDTFPKGLNESEKTKINIPRYRWLQKLVEEYGKIICTCMS